MACRSSNFRLCCLLYRAGPTRGGFVIGFVRRLRLRSSHPIGLDRASAVDFPPALALRLRGTSLLLAQLLSLLPVLLSLALLAHFLFIVSVLQRNMVFLMTSWCPRGVMLTTMASLTDVLAHVSLPSNVATKSRRSMQAGLAEGDQETKR